MLAVICPYCHRGVDLIIGKHIQELKTNGSSEFKCKLCDRTYNIKPDYEKTIVVKNK